MLFRRVMVLLTVMAAPLLAISPDPYTVKGPVLGAYHHIISFEADYLFMDRSDGSRRTLVVSSGGPVDKTLALTDSCDKPEGSIQLTSRNLVNAQGYQPGMSAAVYIYPDQENSFEGRWMGLLSWRGEDSVKCPENLSIPEVGRLTYDWVHASRMRGKYESKLWGFEIDYIRHMSPRYINPFSISARAGLRYFQLKERLELFTSKLGSLVKESPYEWDYSSYCVTTKAEYFGPQVGIDFEYNPFAVLTWGIRLKGGLGANWGKSVVRMGDLNDTIEVLGYGNMGSNFAYIFTGHPFIELRPVKNWTLVVKYELFYLGAVTVAEQQVIFREETFERNFEGIRNHGYFLSHGLQVGIKCNF